MKSLLHNMALVLEPMLTIVGGIVVLIAVGLLIYGAINKDQP